MTLLISYNPVQTIQILKSLKLIDEFQIIKLFYFLLLLHFTFNEKSLLLGNLNINHPVSLKTVPFQCIFQSKNSKPNQIRYVVFYRKRS